MDKRIYSIGLKLFGLVLFVGMALACTTSSNAVEQNYNNMSNGNSDGSYIEVPVDSLANTFDLAAL